MSTRHCCSPAPWWCEPTELAAPIAAFLERFPFLRRDAGYVALAEAAT